MTDPGRGVVYDLGYQPYEGERSGHRGASLAVFRDGLRRVLGLRRKARRKIMPFVLAGIALFPAGFFLAFAVITGDLVRDDLDQPIQLFSNAEYFSFNATVTLLFIALAGTELVLPDRINGTLEIYASRPLRVVDYLGARTAALAALALSFLFLPQLLLIIGDAFVSSQGFFSSLVDDLDTLWQAGATSFVYLVAFAPLAFLVATYATRASFAAGIYLAIMFIVNQVTNGLVEADFSVFGLLSLNHHPRYVADWIFDTNSHAWIPERAGFDPWVSLLVIAAVAVASSYLVLRRYRRLL